VLEIEYAGPIAGHDTRLLTLATQKGLFSAASEDPVSYVNVAQLATERGLEVRATTASASHRYVNLVLVRGGGRTVGGTLFGQGEPRIVLLDEHEIELPFAPWLLVVRNDNRVGMVALVTNALATADININDLHLGRSADKHTAIMAISLEEPVPEAVVKRLRAAPGILDVMPLAEL
jgi:D-3-phosphoglycerate dehydrogenase